ncbi:MAG: Maff2 family protein [Parvimonas sp.]|uniref:Maff2 family mobile element protein n=1 Tax=Parvimonas sp. TaxID=1944660 RepID=UPI0025CBAC47|nr:Maff2 family protein [Parvimonas sp.]MCI5997042.1 Maff2 family protein [Parvimonas sp.]
MQEFTQVVDILQKIVLAAGFGVSLFGGMNLFEAFQNENPAAKTQGIKGLLAGGGIMLIGWKLVPILKNFFS